MLKDIDGKVFDVGDELSNGMTVRAIENERILPSDDGGAKWMSARGIAYFGIYITKKRSLGDEKDRQKKEVDELVNKVMDIIKKIADLNK